MKEGNSNENPLLKIVGGEVYTEEGKDITMPPEKAIKKDTQLGENPIEIQTTSYPVYKDETEKIVRKTEKNVNKKEAEVR